MRQPVARGEPRQGMQGLLPAPRWLAGGGCPCLGICMSRTGITVPAGRDDGGGGANTRIWLKVLAAWGAVDQAPLAFAAWPGIASSRLRTQGCSEDISLPDVAGFLLESKQRVPVVRAPCQILFHARKEEKLLMINCAIGENMHLSNLLLAGRWPFLPGAAPTCGQGGGGELVPRARSLHGLHGEGARAGGCQQLCHILTLQGP